jgi:mannose-1-phosphate guanylyltransferase
MEFIRDLWVVILAGGDGLRVQGLTRDERGNRAPKQFCRFSGDRSLLRRAVDRARRLVQSDRVVAVVRDSQRAWWEPELSDLPRENVLSQSANRGTAIAILHALETVGRRAHPGMALVLPSDHEVEDEDVLASTLGEMVQVAARTDRVVLAGMEAGEPDSEYGWIVPVSGAGRGARPVSRFVEKPEPDLAARLAAAGALVSGFMFAGTVSAMLDLYERAHPGLLDRFAKRAAANPSGALSGPWWEQLPAMDFSRDLLARSMRRLRVLAVPPCGWTDLGTPERLRLWLAQRAHTTAAAS